MLDQCWAALIGWSDWVRHLQMAIEMPDGMVDVLNAIFIAAMATSLATWSVDLFWFTRKVRKVDMSLVRWLDPDSSRWPYIVLFYPVLRELEETMDTAFASLAEMDYPAERFKVIAIPNLDDTATLASIQRLQRKYPFVDLIAVPKTSDPSWARVWQAWDHCPHVYWWHRGKRARNRALPPKKTRQLIYALYKVVADLRNKEDLGNVLIDYIDADSCPPKDHFKAAAIGITIQGFDVLQATNVAGNPLNSMAATMNALDHMAWDGWKYPHQSSGKTPFWVLGKGLFYKASDLVELGGFNPWVTIEDPEVGMRFHKNGKRLGIIEGALIEEVPDTFRKSVIQRKRWVAGFWQSLTSPLTDMGYTLKEKLLAWLIFAPCLSLQLSAVYAFISAWQTYRFIEGTGTLPEWVVYPAVLNVACLVTSLSLLYLNTWKRTRLVLDSFWLRVWYMVRINPLSILLWWLFWTVPLTIGFWMFLTDGGLVWQRTEKLARHRDLVLDRIERGTLGYVDKPLLSDQAYQAAVLGSTLRADTDDIRETPAVAIINGLKQAGVSVRVYDPQGMEHARNVLTGVELCDSVLDACRGADCMVLATEWQQFRSLDARACAKIMRGRTIIELRSNLLDHDALVDEGFTIHNIGRAVRRRELARGQAD